MTHEEELAHRLRGQLDDELGDIQVRAGSRERLRQGLRGRRRAPWLRASVMVPVAAAGVIAAVLLAVPALLHRDDGSGIAPAGVPSGTRETTTVPSPGPPVDDELRPGPSATQEPREPETTPRPARSAMKSTTTPTTPTTRTTSRAEVTRRASATPARSTQAPDGTVAPTARPTQDPTPEESATAG